MASSSGNSSGSLQIQSSGPKEGLMDQRKRKRMQSNRESARRSRMRKQTHLNDLTAQIARIKEENDQIHTNLSITSQHYRNVEAENSVLRAQMGELSQRLDAMNDILNYLDASKGVFGSEVFEAIPESYMNDSWNSMYFNQPIMASADLFLY